MLLPNFTHLQILMLIQKGLNIHEGKFQEEYVKWILCLISKCSKAGQGGSLGGHQKHPLSREEGSEASGYLIISEQNRKTSNWLPEIHRELLWRRLFSANEQCY